MNDPAASAILRFLANGRMSEEFIGQLESALMLRAAAEEFAASHPECVPTLNNAQVLAAWIKKHYSTESFNYIDWLEVLNEAYQAVGSVQKRTRRMLNV